MYVCILFGIPHCQECPFYCVTGHGSFIELKACICKDIP